MFAELPPIQIYTDVAAITGACTTLGLAIGGALTACVNKVLVYLREESAARKAENEARDTRDLKYCEMIEKVAVVLTKALIFLDRQEDKK